MEEKTGQNVVFERIEFFKDDILSDLNPKTIKAIQNKIERFKSSFLMEDFLRIGDTAPDFEITNAEGKKIRLSKLVRQQKIVLSFVRGAWCPYCYLELKAYQKLLPQIEALGAGLLVISSDRPDYCIDTMTRHGLAFEVLSDKGNKVAQKYKLVYKSETDIDLWNELGLMKRDITDDDLSYELPIPATYIIDENMIVRYAYANPDYRRRANPIDIKNILVGLKAL
ncbi:MAG: peroxiredoxin family protein [Candidatus Melainabacteria bacterium]|nr:peroxiredoxin family protein [Candidatus Melainabacteria bacterium]